MDFVDLRSDTVTQPTPVMRAAMASATVGDDVYGEDPTIIKLEEMAAERLGKQAGLFVASGTMGNLVALLTHCGRGDEVILGARSHTFLYEVGGISALGGIHSCQLREQPDGSLDLDEVAEAIRPDDVHDPVTRLVCIENTHNRCGGTFQPPSYIRELCDLAHRQGLQVHMDGARVFNAAAAQGLAASELTAPVDSVTFCLSKGLCAPVGSVLCGSSSFIQRARRIRKQVGGGMRQAGILAAAGIISLESMTGRLVEDHARARRLADGLRNLDGLVLDEGSPATNIIFMNLSPHVKISASQVAAKLKEYGVLVGLPGGERRFRLVLHYYIDDAGVEKTVSAFRQTLA
jgi:threonine aldolase